MPVSNHGYKLLSHVGEQNDKYWILYQPWAQQRLSRKPEVINVIGNVGDDLNCEPFTVQWALLDSTLI